MLASEVKKYCLRRILAQDCSRYECHKYQMTENELIIIGNCSSTI